MSGDEYVTKEVADRIRGSLEGLPRIVVTEERIVVEEGWVENDVVEEEDTEEKEEKEEEFDLMKEALFFPVGHPDREDLGELENVVGDAVGVKGDEVYSGGGDVGEFYDEGGNEVFVDEVSFDDVGVANVDEVGRRRSVLEEVGFRDEEAERKREMMRRFKLGI